MSSPCIDEYGNDICHLADYSRSVKPKPISTLSQTRVRTGGFRPPTKPTPLTPPPPTPNLNLLYSKYQNTLMNYTPNFEMNDTKIKSKTINSSNQNNDSRVMVGTKLRSYSARIKNRNFKDLPSDERLSARMTKSSYINLTEGSHASNAYATEHISGWKIDERFTSEHISVFVEKSTGNVRVSFRGTQTNADWHTNKAFLTMRVKTRAVS